VIGGRAFRLRKGTASWGTPPAPIVKKDFNRRAAQFFGPEDVIVVQIAPPSFSQPEDNGGNDHKEN